MNPLLAAMAFLSASTLAGTTFAQTATPPADLAAGVRRIEAAAAPVPGPDGGPARFRLPSRVAHTDTARLYARTGAGRAEVPRTQWGFVDSRTIQLLPIGRAPDAQQSFELDYEAVPGS